MFYVQTIFYTASGHGRVKALLRHRFHRTANTPRDFECFAFFRAHVLGRRG